jgi:hypothetical protein
MFSKPTQRLPPAHFSLAALTFGKTGAPPSFPILLAESASPDRSACPYDSRRDFFESTAPNQRGHTICRYLLFTRGSILMIRMQTPDGWITVAGPRNARTGAASCLQSLTPPRKVLDLPGPVIGNLLLKRAGCAFKRRLCLP